MSQSSEEAKYEKLAEAARQVTFRVMTVGVWSPWVPKDMIFVGYNIKLEAYSCLLMVKAMRKGGARVIAFVGAEDVPAACAKLVRMCKEGTVAWREDRPFNGSVDKTP